ncbi:MAG: ABC transporter substrate-binding protein [Dehalococcoidia bacterium]|nr:MAG: ABC transporter substrate-binding protein [Dehalococcoidia bacterium]
MLKWLPLLARWARFLGPVVLLSACLPAASTTPTPGSVSRYPDPLPPEQPITIRFESYLLATAGPNREAQLQLLDQFSQRFPHIRVETKATPSQEIVPSIRAQLAAGDPPDLAMLLLREWDLVVENIAPKPLEQIVPPEELSAHLGGEFPFHPRALALTRRAGQLFGLPWVFSTPTLFYNADLFRQAGLDPDRPPTTWDEVKQQGLQIARQSGKPALYIACLELDWCAQSLVFSNGGRLVSEDRRRTLWGEPAFIDTYRMWQDLVTSGVHARLTGAEALDAFAAGNLAMYLDTSANQARLIAAARNRWELRTAGMPAFGTKPVKPVNSGAGLGILASDPRKQRAAWELMKFLTTPEAYVIITRDMGYLPLRTSLINDPRYLKDWAQGSLILPNLQQLDGLEPSISYPGDNHVQIRDLFLKTQQAVVLQGADPDRAWREAQARAQELMPR